jgi:hypothetical protein
MDRVRQALFFNWWDSHFKRQQSRNMLHFEVVPSYKKKMALKGRWFWSTTKRSDFLSQPNKSSDQGRSRGLDKKIRFFL